MKQNDDYQGKKPSQIRDSEIFFFWSIVGIIVLAVILKLFN